MKYAQMNVWINCKKSYETCIISFGDNSISNISEALKHIFEIYVIF